MEQSSLADVLTDVARSLEAPKTLDDTFNAITHTARDTIPGVDYASISIAHRGGRIDTVAPTDPLVCQLDELQYELSEGPCVDALREASLILVNEMSADERWPNYGPKAASLGIGSQMAFRLYTDDTTLGGLNLYSTQVGAFDDDSRHVGHLFATHAAIAMGAADKQDNLNEALASRKLIGQAIGIVMERYGLSEDRAFGFLLRVSQTGNIKLRSVAAEIVDTVNKQAGDSTEGRPAE